MAMSVVSPNFPPLIWEHARCFVSVSHPHSSSSKFTPSSSLRFSEHQRGSQFGNSGISFTSHLRIRHLVQAKKELFSSFEDMLEKSMKPLLVDFYATWCGPCQFMVPILDEASTLLGDKIQVVKIDVEKYPTVASKYRIEALPTFILFKDGKPHDRFEGALNANDLVKRIENSLNVKQ